MKRKIIVGNWKMNPTTAGEASRIFKAIKKTALKLTSTTVVMCPPFVYIQKLAAGPKTMSPVVSVGAENVYSAEQGAFTGEVSAPMLKDLGVTHVIVGHSERRSGIDGVSESDEIIAKKVQAVLDAGMNPILCVGERERDAHGLYLDVLKNQIKNSLALTQKKFVQHLIVAYEPVWAIGAKEAMEASVIEEMTIFIRKVLSDIYGQENVKKTPILYGGSINFRNAPDIIARGKVDGLLVGRESVNTPGFVELLKAVDVL